MILWILAAPFVWLYELIAAAVDWLWDVFVVLAPVLGIGIGVVFVAAAVAIYS